MEYRLYAARVFVTNWPRADGNVLTLLGSA